MRLERIGPASACRAAARRGASHGHRRFETLATLAIGGLMPLAARKSLQTTVERLLYGGRWRSRHCFGVMIGTMALNLGVIPTSAARLRIAFGVLLARARTRPATLSCVLRAGNRHALGFRIDVVAALIIVIITGARVQHRARRERPPITDLIQRPSRLGRRAGVEETVRVRSRGPVDAPHVDIDTRIKPAVTTDHAYAIAAAIEERLRGAYPEVDEIQVHFAPQRHPATDYALEARAVADALGLNIHEVIPIPVRDGIALEMHVEVQPGLSRASAPPGSELERRLKTAIPKVREC
jgi:divalent metal cation (Fe/Co/Zn/Cd) transporter